MPAVSVAFLNEVGMVHHIYIHTCSFYSGSSIPSEPFFSAYGPSTPSPLPVKIDAQPKDDRRNGSPSDL